MLFKDIPGLENIKKRLVQTVHENRISHAQLFYGEEGSAALPLALAYAQYITCIERGENDSCGKCTSCIKSEELIHPDILFSYPVVKSGITGKYAQSTWQIKKWREIISKNPYIGPSQWYEYMGVENKQGMIYTEESDEIIRKISFKAFESEYKVLIQWLPEKMNKNAANKLLKLIEEPPDKTVFLFVSIEAEQILPTLLSRCQVLKIPKIGEANMKAFLTEHYHLPEKELDRTVQRANGNMQEALRLIRNRNEENTFLQLFIRWMRVSYALNMAELTAWVDEMVSLGREKQKAFLKYALNILRENMMLHILPPTQRMVRMTTEEYEFSKKFSDFIHPDNMEVFYARLNLAYDHIAGNAYARLIFLDESLQINKLLKK